MVNCPNCGSKLDAPEKKIENNMFSLAVYRCKKCGNRFKVSN
jgi:DNA-directed RNA polymerase subunit RPC12/RpoP